MRREGVTLGAGFATLRQGEGRVFQYRIHCAFVCATQPHLRAASSAALGSGWGAVGLGCCTPQPNSLDQGQDAALSKPWAGGNQAPGPGQMGLAVLRAVPFPETLRLLPSQAVTDLATAGPRGERC